MTNKVFCSKLKKYLPGLDSPPIPGELGIWILNNVSHQSWKDWLAYQVILINENQLSLISSKDRLFLIDELKKYFYFNK